MSCGCGCGGSGRCQPARPFVSVSPTLPGVMVTPTPNEWPPPPSTKPLGADPTCGDARWQKTPKGQSFRAPCAAWPVCARSDVAAWQEHGNRLAAIVRRKAMQRAQQSGTDAPVVKKAASWVGRWALANKQGGPAFSFANNDAVTLLSGLVKEGACVLDEVETGKVSDEPMTDQPIFDWPDFSPRGAGTGIGIGVGIVAVLALLAMGKNG